MYEKYARHINANDELVKWVNTTLKNYLSNNQPTTDEVEHILDYLVQSGKRLAKMSYDQAKKLTEKWDKTQQIVSSGDYARVGSSGYGAQIDSSGYRAKIGSSGDYAQIDSSGYRAKIGSSGNYAQIGSSGDYANLGSSGNYTKIGSSGNYAQIGGSGNGSQIDSLGYRAKIGSSGDDAQINVSGRHSVGSAIGVDSTAKGAIGNWIVLAEWVLDGDHYKPKCVKAVQIDGVVIKENTCYKLKDCEFVEAYL